MSKELCTEVCQDGVLDLLLIGGNQSSRLLLQQTLPSIVPTCPDSDHICNEKGFLSPMSLGFTLQFSR
jgi:hypothetical protein